MPSSPGPSKLKSMKKRFKNLFKRSPSSESSRIAHESSSSNNPLAGEPRAEKLKISARFARSILPKIAECVDGNPAQMAFKILKVIMEVRKEINESQDELQRILEETLLLLSTVLAKMETGSNPQGVVGQTVEQYKREVNQQLERITALNSLLHSSAFTQIDYENYKVQLTDISRRIREATVRFNTAMAGTTGITVDEIRGTIQDDKHEKKLREDLQPSGMADHRFIHEGKSGLKREICTEGTRANILNGITEWANDSSVGSASVYWLTGQAGAGKTTIAYTIAKHFGTGQPTILGANFFCSRQLLETRSLQRIVPTLAYQLTRKCETYRAALHGVDTSDAVHSYNVQEQLEKFLLQPWMKQKRSHSQPMIYLVVVDALDEIEDSDRSMFLEQLLKSLQTDNITGLKFLVTSRPDPDIVNLCKIFPSDAVCKLQDVPIEEAKQDIGIYLDLKLKNLSATPEFSKLKEQSAGLFIYAATVVKILTGRKLASSEQLKRLRALLSVTSSDSGPIDQLYQQVVREAFSDLDDDPELLSTRLSILHTFLCSAERISASVAASLLGTDVHIANIVLENLHSVLYVQDDMVYWYHASFPDFIFSHVRSNFREDDKKFDFSCDAAAQHGLLTHACFRIMNSKDNGLRFNIGNIKSSYLLDREHAEELRENIDENILPVLRYACFHWTHHLAFVTDGNNSLFHDVISNFLEIRVLFWIEAMNLLGQSGDCSYLLRNAGDWASKNKLALAKDLQEAANLATYFSGCPATDSTPHLYLSSLATWQSTSLLSQSWKHQFSCFPLYKHTKGIVAIPLMTKEVNSQPFDITFSPDGKQIVAKLSGSVVVLDSATGRQQHVLDLGSCWEVKFSSDGTRLMIVTRSGNDRIVCIYNTSSFQLLKTLKVLDARISIEGTHIITTSTERDQMQILDISTGTWMRTIKLAALTERHSTTLITFSSVSNRLLIASPRSIELWDISSECALKALTLDQSDTEHLTSHLTIMSPDGRLVARSSDQYSIRVQDTFTGSVVLQIQRQKTYIRSINFSYDSTRMILAFGLEDGTLSLWDTSTGAKLRDLVHDLASDVASIAFSRDGSRIASASRNRSIYVWSLDVLAVTQVGESDAHNDEMNIAISNDCKKIMSTTRGKVQIWDATTGTQILALPDTRIESSSLSGNGEIIVSSVNWGPVKVWNASTGDEMLCLNPSGANENTRSVASSRSGRKIAFVNGFRPRVMPKDDIWPIEIWDLETRESIKIAPFNGTRTDASFLFFSDDEQFILAGSMIDTAFKAGAEMDDELGDGSSTWIVVWDVLTGNVIHKLKSVIGGDYHRLFSSNGREVAICAGRIIPGLDNELCEVWDISSGKRRRMMKTSYSPPSNYGEERGQFRLDSFGLSKDGRKIVVACSDGVIRIWSDVSNETGAAHVTIVGRSLRRMLCSITFSKDNNQVVTGSGDGSVQVWDMGTDKYEWTLQEDGWITSTRNKEHRLMWVSEVLEVRQPHNTLIIAGPGHGSVDFTGAMIGEGWEKCYSATDSVVENN